MSSFYAGTRSSARRRGAVAAPAAKDLPAAVRKLGNKEAWNFPSKSLRKINLESPPPPKVAASAKAPPVVEKENLVVDTVVMPKEPTKNKVDYVKSRDCFSASDVQRAEIPRGDKIRNTDFAVNCLFVLSQMLSGDGGTESSKLLGFLDLPRPTSMGPDIFPAMESELANYVIPLVEELLEQNLIEEVTLANQQNPDFSLLTWMEHWKKGIPMAVEDMPRIKVSYDMGWQKRSSGRRYDSHSGHAMAVGTMTRKSVWHWVMSKHCRICSKSDDPGDHDCCANFDATASSGSMEPSALVEIAHCLIDNHSVVIETVISDDDSSMKAQMRWSNEDWMVANKTNTPPMVVSGGKKIPRPNTGKLKYPHPQPTFLADPAHRKKTLRKHLYSRCAKKISERGGLHKIDCIKVSKNFGYMSKQLREQPKHKWLPNGAAVLDHYFEDHGRCGDWCKRRKMKPEELRQDRQKKGNKFYRDKAKDRVVHETLKEMLEPFITMERLEEIGHGFDTQINESLNNTISWLAPKNKTYCGSIALRCRVASALGIHLIGFKPFVCKLLGRLGIKVTPGTVWCLETVYKKKEVIHEPHKKKEFKAKREESNRKKMQEQMKDIEKKRRKDGFYGPGEAFNVCLPVVADDVCPHCLKKGHKLTRSQHCDKNPRRMKLKAQKDFDEAQQMAMERIRQLTE